MAAPEQVGLTAKPGERRGTLPTAFRLAWNFTLRRRAAILFSLALLCTIALRLIPFDPPIIRDWAELSIRQQISAQIAARAPADPAELDRSVDRLIADNRDKLEPVRRDLARTYRDAISFEGGDGKRHVYLGGDDGYYWLKLARSYLMLGTVCDRMEQGQCIDALGNAPLGQPIDYIYSPHVVLIADLYRLLSWVRPGTPLSLSGMLLPLLLSALAVIPAFLLIARLAGPLGAFIGTMAIFANSFVLARTVDGDDDIWAVAAPLFAIWLLSEALMARSSRNRLALALLAGGALGLLAAVWQGWPFFALVILAGIAATLGWTGSRTVLQRREPGRLRHDLLGAAAIVMAMAAAFAIVCWLFQVSIDTAAIFHELARTLGAEDPTLAPIDTAPWPNTFAVVGELGQVRASLFLEAMGPVAFGLGLVGLSAGFLPHGARKPWIEALLLAAAAICAAGLARFGTGRAAALLAFAVPSALAMMLGALRERGDEAASASARLLCLTWLGAALVLAFAANRYVMLAMVPLGIAVGAAVGQFGADLAAWTRARGRGTRWAAPLAVLGLSGLVLGPLAAQGYAQMRSHFPRVNGAWVATFLGIKQETAPSGIVNIWWDYGHWAKYFTERPVTTDGASLRNRTNYWLAKALAASSDGESIALLRMLNCGTVTDPDDGARARPFETLLKWAGGDEALAHRTLAALARLPREQHMGYLSGVGLLPARSAALLRTVDCAPPDSELVLTTDLLKNRSWYVDGYWDPYRAYLIELVRRLPKDRAAAAAAEKFSLPSETARLLIEQAAEVRTEEDRLNFAAPEGRRAFSTGWQTCIPEGERFRCPLDFGGDERTTRIVELVYDAADPTRARFRLAAPPGQGVLEQPPELIELARPDRLEETKPSGPTVQGAAALIDPEAHRVFIAAPTVLRSTLVRLVLLDGRYSPQFRKTQDHLAFDGERITSWQILWDRP